MFELAATVASGIVVASAADGAWLVVKILILGYLGQRVRVPPIKAVAVNLVQQFTGYKIVST